MPFSKHLTNISIQSWNCIIFFIKRLMDVIGTFLLCACYNAMQCYAIQYNAANVVGTKLVGKPLLTGTELQNHLTMSNRLKAPKCLAKCIFTMPVTIVVDFPNEPFGRANLVADLVTRMPASEY